MSHSPLTKRVGEESIQIRTRAVSFVSERLVHIFALYPAVTGPRSDRWYITRSARSSARAGTHATRRSGAARVMHGREPVSPVFLNSAIYTPDCAQAKRTGRRAGSSIRQQVGRTVIQRQFFRLPQTVARLSV